MNKRPRIIKKCKYGNILFSSTSLLCFFPITFFFSNKNCKIIRNSFLTIFSLFSSFFLHPNSHSFHFGKNHLQFFASRLLHSHWPEFNKYHHQLYLPIAHLLILNFRKENKRSTLQSYILNFTYNFLHAELTKVIFCSTAS